MTSACLHGWMVAAATDRWGWGSTVMVLRACSSDTSCRICASGGWGRAGRCQFVVRIGVGGQRNACHTVGVGVHVQTSTTGNISCWQPQLRLMRSCGERQDMYMQRTADTRVPPAHTPQRPPPCSSLSCLLPGPPPPGTPAPQPTCCGVSGCCPSSKPTSQKRGTW
jgi:hypothetical protein